MFVDSQRNSVGGRFCFVFKTPSSAIVTAKQLFHLQILTSIFCKSHHWLVERLKMTVVKWACFRHQSHPEWRIDFVIKFLFLHVSLSGFNHQWPHHLKCSGQAYGWIDRLGPVLFFFFFLTSLMRSGQWEPKAGHFRSNYHPVNRSAVCSATAAATAVVDTSAS